MMMPPKAMSHVGVAAGAGGGAFRTSTSAALAVPAISAAAPMPRTDPLIVLAILIDRPLIRRETAKTRPRNAIRPTPQVRSQANRSAEIRAMSQ
jgi:hypothetical protein